MARPRKQIDLDQLKKCAAKQWPDTEIAAWFQKDGFSISAQTIRRRYGELIDTARLNGKSKLRDLQWSVASAGDVKMMIHLGKHYLGQHDKVDIDASVKSGFLKVDKIEGGVIVGAREFHKTENDK